MKGIHSYLLEPPFALPIAGTDGWRLVRPFSEFFKRVGISGAGSPNATFALLSAEPDTSNWTLVRIAEPMFNFLVSPPRLEWVDDPLPTYWMLWVFEQLYGLDPFSLTDPGLLEDLPVTLPSGTWARLEQIEHDAELEPLKAAFLWKDPKSKEHDPKSGNALKVAITERLFLAILSVTSSDAKVKTSGVPSAPSSRASSRGGQVIREYQEGNPWAFAVAGVWYFKLPGKPGKHLQLDVYRRRNTDDSISVAFEIEQRNAGETTKLGSGSTLLEAMKTSGLWIEEGEKQAWKKRHIAQPTWLIDRSIIEPYRLLGVPSPLVRPRVDLLEWLTEAST